jgi:hypothetical protein
MLLALAGCPYCDIGAIPCEGDGNCPTGARCHGGACCNELESPCECQQMRACDAFLQAELGFTASELSGVDPGCRSQDCVDGCIAALITAQNLVEGEDLGPCEPIE